ncbi:IPT/TIG domain-containing protein [Legionella beliardensis]|nr:IPT/TIG domain-containing protein [Legionella beliardensis]
MASVLPLSPPSTPSSGPLGKPAINTPTINVGPWTPLLNYAQTGTLTNLSLTNQQLGLSGPLNWGVTYSDLTGTFFNAQYILPLGERIAFGVLGEYGADQYRINGTVGYGLSPLAQVKFTAERFGQRLPFQFDSGKLDQRVHQDAYGIRFQQLFNLPVVQGIHAGGYYASAVNQRLNPLIFTSNGINCGGYEAGLQCINYRHIAGATSIGIDAGVELLLTPATWMQGTLYYDQIYYHTAFTPHASEDRDGLGAGIAVNRLLGERLKVSAEASAREIYNTYQAGLSWLPNLPVLGLELSLLGQHITSHNATPDNNQISVQVSFLGARAKAYEAAHHWGGQQLGGISQWVGLPAVKMQQVLAIAEQITKLLAPSISAVSPNTGPLTGGNTVTIIGTNFAQGLLVFFGSQVARGIEVLSPNLIKVIVPAPPVLPTTLQARVAAEEAVDVIVQNPDGQQAFFPNGYLYVTVAQPTIASLTPAVGSTAGGTVVIITGEHLGTTSQVTFNGAPALINQVTDTQVIVTTAAHAAGVVAVVLTTSAGQVTKANAFTYVVPPPTLTSLTPTTGPVAGGQTVTLTGTNLTGTTNVTFGGVPATGISVVNDSTVTVVTPAGLAGPVDVTVTTTGGSATLAGGYAYLAAPTITTLNPSAGPVAGGQAVTLTGANLSGTTSVTFGGTPVTSVTVVNDATLLVVTPAGPVGPVGVTVTTTSGSATLSSGYTYVAAPTITTINPTSGSTTGGQTVTITGTNLTGTTSVTFGSTPATGVTVVNDATVTVVTPAGLAGPVDVTLTATGGSVTVPGGHVYVTTPTITLINPNAGPVTGGQTVTITGANLTGTNSVTFGGTPATGVTVVNDSTVTVVTPAGIAGPVDVTVTTVGGSVTIPGGYTYVTAPTITTINPTAGPAAGGQTVTITGTNLTGTNSVTFDGTPATGVTVVNDSTVTVVTPAGIAGPVDVMVTTVGGSETVPGGYTYVAAPTITTVNPTAGPAAGGQTVTITGTNLTGTTSVTFGGAPATGITVVNDSTVTVVTPAGTAGSVDVTLTTVGGSATAAGAYTYVAAPTIITINPTSGPELGGQTVTITGTNLIGTTNVTFGGTPATGVTVVNDSTVTVVTPAVPAGAVDVTLTTVGGSVTVPGGYTYLPTPFILSINPDEGPMAGGQTVTLTGTNLTGTTSVTFDGVPGTSVTVLNDSTVTVVTPAGTAGAVNVTVTAPGGTYTIPLGYTYVNPPLINGISPGSGPAAGGQTVTISGANLTGTTSVTFDGIPATGITVVNDSSVTVVTPANTTGPADVVVTAIGGSTTVPGGYTYVVAVGDSYLGGIVYLVDGAGTSGRVVSATDSSSFVSWSSSLNNNVSTSLTNGAQNTTNIINTDPACTTTLNCAARYCRQAAGFDANWFLPARDEFNAIYTSGIVGFSVFPYWSSSQFNISNAYQFSFSSGGSLPNNKTFPLPVRCIRTFSP